MPVFAGGRIEAYVGPRELGAADDLEAVVCDFIAGARTSLRGTPPTPPRTRGDETPQDALHRVQWAEDTTSLAANRRILAALLRSDVQVHGDFNPHIFHQKFVLRDYPGKATPTSALLTGSANFTRTDTHTNLNHVFVFHHAYVCRQYADELAQLRRGQFGRGLHGAVPRTYDVGGIPVKVLFAPDHTPELEIMKQMLKGSEEVLFAIFTFAGSSGIDDTMLALARGGMRVRGVLDPDQARQKWAAPAWLVHPRIEVSHDGARALATHMADEIERMISLSDEFRPAT